MSRYNLSQIDRMHQITVSLLGWGEQRKSNSFPSASALSLNARMTTTSLLNARIASILSHYIRTYFACGCDLGMSPTRCPLHIAFCLHAPHSMLPVLSPLP